MNQVKIMHMNISPNKYYPMCKKTNLKNSVNSMIDYSLPKLNNAYLLVMLDFGRKIKACVADHGLW